MIKSVFNSVINLNPHLRINAMKYILFAILFASLLLSACQPANLNASEGDQTPAPNNDDTLDAQDLGNALASAGATIGHEGEVDQPFFSVPGQVITANGESVQVFEYADAAQADAEAEQVAPDGSSIGTTMATWIGPPHFYRADHLIVLYVGDNQSLMELLETLLGPQFAGAETSAESDFPSEPPPAILQIGEAEQVSGISGYCWTVPGKDHGICADGIGFGTSSDPLVVESTFVARFTNPLSEAMDSLMLSVRPLEPDDKLPDEPGGLYWWRPKSKDQILEHLSPPYEVELTLEPGLYLFNYFATWEEFGDASYGFLVEVASEAG
jgi:hypothetical protein